MGCNSSKHFDPEGPSPPKSNKNAIKGNEPKSSRRKKSKREKMDANAAFHSDAPWINKEHKVFVRDEEAVAGGRIISREVYSPPNFEHIPYPEHLKEQAAKGPQPSSENSMGRNTSGRI